MHINKVVSRSGRNIYVKFLLRRTYRDGQKTKKITVANLSKWSAADRQNLINLLMAQRKLRAKHEKIDTAISCQIFSLLLSNAPMQSWWRFTQCPMVPTLNRAKWIEQMFS